MGQLTVADGISYHPLAPQVEAKADRSDDIRAAALELFTRLGYEATTMAGIVAAVGMRGPSLASVTTPGTGSRPSSATARSAASSSRIAVADNS
ncbi:TetR/AcrR family transcriptional regulator [Streptomyces sp. NPDC050619]|uniref:TetR/AcrR family transcriptional regulator n=1 Tax=Streptomyces sp. NPDC050619 TaxID=3157214 RepID=UPI003429B187